MSVLYPNKRKGKKKSNTIEAKNIKGSCIVLDTKRGLSGQWKESVQCRKTFMQGTVGERRKFDKYSNYIILLPPFCRFGQQISCTDRFSQTWNIEEIPITPLIFSQGTGLFVVIKHVMLNQHTIWDFRRIPHWFLWWSRNFICSFMSAKDCVRW